MGVCLCGKGPSDSWGTGREGVPLGIHGRARGGTSHEGSANSWNCRHCKVRRAMKQRFPEPRGPKRWFVARSGEGMHFRFSGQGRAGDSLARALGEEQGRPRRLWEEQVRTVTSRISRRNQWRGGNRDSRIS